MWLLLLLLVPPLWGLCRCFYMPGFFKYMPRKNEPGPWIAVAMKTSPFYGCREAAWRKHDSLLRAYISARWLALKLDWAAPHCDGELGVDWGVRRPLSSDPEGL